MADALGIYNYYDPDRAGWQALPDDYSPEIAGMLDATDDPGSVIRALMAESRALAKAQEPTLMDSLSTLSATHRRKLPGRAQGDAQRKHFLTRALEIYGRPEGDRTPSAWARLPEEIQTDMRNYATNAEGFRDNIDKPYEYTGWLGQGSKLNAAGKWLQSIPAAAYQGSHMLANAAGNLIDGQGGQVKTTEQALDDFTTAGATAWAPVTSMLGMDSSVPSSWSRSRQARQAMDEEKTPWLQEEFRIDDRQRQRESNILEGRAGAQDDGESLLTDYQVDTILGKMPVRIWGGIMDDTLNPMWEGAGIVSAARAGKHAAAARGLAMEHAPSILLGGYTTYLENEMDKKLKRLEEARR